MSDKPKRRTQRKIHFRRCIILGCGLTSRNSNRDVSFHTLPKATLGWVRTNCAQHLPTGINLCRVFICSRHYHPSYLNVTPAPGARRLLTTNAIPTIFPPFSAGESSRNGEAAPVGRHEDCGNSSSSTASDDLDSAIIPPLTAGPISASASEASSSSSSETPTDSEPEEEPDKQTTCRPKRTTIKARPPAPPPTTTTPPPVIDELRLAVEGISLQCDRVVAALDKLDHRRIPLELLTPLRDLVEKIQSTSQRKRSSVEASIEIFGDDIRIREERLQLTADNNDGDVDAIAASALCDDENLPIEIHMTTDMCYEGINFRHHRLN